MQGWGIHGDKLLADTRQSSQIDQEMIEKHTALDLPIHRQIYVDVKDYLIITIPI